MRWLAPAVFACAVALPSVAAAQSSTPPAAAAGSLGGMAVVGLRTPDGDVDIADALSGALRDAARARGYDVPASTPSFDQEFAMVGCATTSPECLSLIAADIHAQKYLYGTLLRVGRGRDAPMSIEVSLWDEVTHREVHREAATLTRAQMAASPDFVRDLARRMIDALATRDASAQAERERLLQAEAALRAREAGAQGGASQGGASQGGSSQGGSSQGGASQGGSSQGGSSQGTTPAGNAHLLRWVGFGLLGVGVVAGGIGVWQWASTSGYGDDSLNGTGDYGGAWARYDNRINPANAAGVRMLSENAVCDRARADMANDADARGAANLCDAHGSAQTLAIAFGVGGLVLAGVGAALVIVDGMGSGARSEGRPQPAQARLRVSPVLAPGLGGVNVGMTF
ncbi:MAG: hypothetical protein U0324_18330 [Polyangiales bacterium]